MTANADWQPRFLPGPAGQFFVLHFSPRTRAGRPRGIVFCPPFAEEMNRSRRCVRLAAQAMAAAGHEVLIVDLHGTGDSAGDFADGSWSLWLEELAAAAAWLRNRDVADTVFWGLRTGAALAVEAAARGDAERLLLWQPVVGGKTFVTQFLRMRLAADMMAGDAGNSTGELRALLTGGRSVEVGGYPLTPALVESLDAIDLLAAPPVVPVHWVEVVAAAERPFTAASRKAIEVWEGAGVWLEDAKIVGPSFWTTPEITVPAELVEHAGALAARWRDSRGLLESGGAGGVAT